VSTVAPGAMLALMKAWMCVAWLLGMAASRMRPESVSRYFCPRPLALCAFPVARSITSTAPMTMILPVLSGVSGSSSVRNGISVWSTSTTPSSGSRLGSTIERRSFCASSQAVL
jgi:hypothetical protein